MTFNTPLMKFRKLHIASKQLGGIFLLSFVLGGLSGCSSFGKSLKSFVGGKPSEDKTVSTPVFSEQQDLPYHSDRQYRRMNRQKFEEEADIAAGAGSLWVMEGQGAYLFSQNQTRMVGDLLNVRIEGAPKSQLVTKVKVISRLLARLEHPQRGLASKTPAPQGANESNAQQGANGAQGNEDQNQNATGGTNANQNENEKDSSPFAVQVVPTRIVEQLKDGSYRVRGIQPFMIGKREYKVIVTGVVRPEDFDDAGIDSSKLLDPQFDIVSSRKGASL